MDKRTQEIIDKLRRSGELDEDKAERYINREKKENLIFLVGQLLSVASGIVFIFVYLFYGYKIGIGISIIAFVFFTGWRMDIRKNDYKLLYLYNLGKKTDGVVLNSKNVRTRIGKCTRLDYSFNNENNKGTCYYFTDKPSLAKGDSVRIYYDPKKPKISVSYDKKLEKKYLLISEK